MPHRLVVTAPPVVPSAVTEYVIEFHVSRAAELLDWLERMESTFGPFAEEHPARKMRVALIDAQRKLSAAS